MTPPRSRREDLAARAAAVTTHANPDPPADESDGEPAPATPRRARGGAPPPRTRPVRITVDLAPVDHRALKRWADDAADEVGTAGVALADVVRVLLDRLHADPALRQAVIEGLRERRS
ncbi:MULTISPECIES: hypothetical protein [Frankia]|uniref:ATPase n=1 Tax=Candidatus Frankia alpina TaxID=2699483 RepID=A0A4S5EQS2_9ACTN|nr:MULTISPECIES: hypothetical protein [Frankia]THJ74767.1 hypothetical protein E7Y31_09465 [Candidatus Frankia alpina]